MWCCSEHSGEQIWKAESPQSKLNEVSQPLSFDHLLKEHSQVADLQSNSKVYVLKVLKEYSQVADLQSNSKVYVATSYPPQVLQEKKWFLFDNKDEDWPELIMF